MDMELGYWAELPKDLLNLIIRRLDRNTDYLNFGSVCKQWQCVARESNVNHKMNQYVLKVSKKKLPMLIITRKDQSNKQRELYDVCEGVTYNVELPIRYDYKFIGSSHGWLFCVDTSMTITLVNPFINGHISLPVLFHPNKVFQNKYRLKNFEYYMHKGILTSDPSASPNNYQVVVTYGHLCQLAFFKSDTLFWDFINLGPECDFVFDDIICYKGNIYAVTLRKQLVRVDIGSKTIETIIASEIIDVNTGIYLVESQEGELLLVKRFSSEFSDNDYDLEGKSLGGFNETTYGFTVFKLVYEGESAAWLPINNIGQQALFVGENHSISISTIEFPKCQPNSIYFTTQNYLRIPPYVCYGPDEDSGIFNLEDQSIHLHHVLDMFEWHKQPPIWFVPNPE